MDKITESITAISSLVRAQDMLIDHLKTNHLTVEEQNLDPKLKMYEEYIKLIKKDLGG